MKNVEDRFDVDLFKSISSVSTNSDSTAKYELNLYNSRKLNVLSMIKYKNKRTISINNNYSLLLDKYLLSFTDTGVSKPGFINRLSFFIKQEGSDGTLAEDKLVLIGDLTGLLVITLIFQILAVVVKPSIGTVGWLDMIGVTIMVSSLFLVKVVDVYTRKAINYANIAKEFTKGKSMSNAVQQIKEMSIDPYLKLSSLFELYMIEETVVYKNKESGEEKVDDVAESIRYKCAMKVLYFLLQDNIRDLNITEEEFLYNAGNGDMISSIDLSKVENMNKFKESFILIGYLMKEEGIEIHGLEF